MAAASTSWLLIRATRWRFATAECSPAPFTPSSPTTLACTPFSWRWRRAPASEARAIPKRENERRRRVERSASREPGEDPGRLLDQGQGGRGGFDRR